MAVFVGRRCAALHTSFPDIMDLATMAAELKELQGTTDRLMKLQEATGYGQGRRGQGCNQGQH